MSQTDHHDRALHGRATKLVGNLGDELPDVAAVEQTVHVHAVTCARSRQIADDGSVMWRAAT